MKGFRDTLASSSALDSYTQRLTQALLAQKEAILLAQFNDLIKSNVLIVEETQPVLVTSASIDGEKEVRLEQAVRLRFRGQEEIERLQAENAQLKVQLEKIRAVFGGPNADE